MVDKISLRQWQCPRDAAMPRRGARQARRWRAAQLAGDDGRPLSPPPAVSDDENGCGCRDRWPVPGQILLVSLGAGPIPLDYHEDANLHWIARKVQGCSDVLGRGDHSRDGKLVFGARVLDKKSYGSKISDLCWAVPEHERVFTWVFTWP